MLYLKHGDAILFRMKRSHAFEPGTWDACINAIRDQFGNLVRGTGITYEGCVCDPTLPGTASGREAFCMIPPFEYRHGG